MGSSRSGVAKTPMSDVTEQSPTQTLHLALGAGAVNISTNKSDVPDSNRGSLTEHSAPKAGTPTASELRPMQPTEPVGFIVGRPVSRVLPGGADWRDLEFSSQHCAVKLLSASPGTWKAATPSEGAHVTDATLAWPFHPATPWQLSVTIAHVLYSYWLIMLREHCARLGWDCDYHWAVFPVDTAVKLATASRGCEILIDADIVRLS
jgi:hypothetical protein